MFRLDKHSPQPLSLQIEQQLMELLSQGRVATGVRLPAIRVLASQLGVSANTVVAAYDRLVAEGHVEARGRLGYFTRPSGAIADPVGSGMEVGLDPDAAWLAQQADEAPADVLQASIAALPPSWLADAVPARVLHRASVELTGGMATRCPPQGWPPLRERLATLMRMRGIPVDASQVLTTTGATQAIELICRAFLKPGDTVIVEDPGYHLMADRLRRAGVHMALVRRHPHGWDLAQFERIVDEVRPKMVFVQPALHNPTGWSASPDSMFRLLSIATRAAMLVVEDDVWGHLLPGSATTLAQLGGPSKVIYCSSFCKVLAPALRVGYISADTELLRPMLREKLFSALYGPALTEAVMTELLATGTVRKHLDRLQQRLAQARQACLTSLKESGVTFDEPARAGLFLWGKLPNGRRFEDVQADAQAHGVQLAGGRTFGSQADSQASVRFNVVHAQHPRLRQWMAGVAADSGDSPAHSASR